jgi:hypothetical protein
MEDEQYIIMCEQAKEIQGRSTIEQLVGMIPDSTGAPAVDILSYIITWANESMCPDCGSNEYSTSFKTIEQLILAYVMSERFQKVWDADRREWLRKP